VHVYIGTRVSIYTHTSLETLGDSRHHPEGEHRRVHTHIHSHIHKHIRLHQHIETSRCMHMCTNLTIYKLSLSLYRRSRKKDGSWCVSNLSLCGGPLVLYPPLLVTHCNTLQDTATHTATHDAAHTETRTASDRNTVLSALCIECSLY